MNPIEELTVGSDLFGIFSPSAGHHEKINEIIQKVNLLMEIKNGRLPRKEKDTEPAYPCNVSGE